MARVKNNGYAKWSLTDYSVAASNVSGGTEFTNPNFATATEYDPSSLSTLAASGGISLPSCTREGIWSMGVSVRYKGTPVNPVFAITPQEWSVKFNNNPVDTSVMRLEWAAVGYPLWAFTTSLGSDDTLSTPNVPEMAGCIVGYFLAGSTVRVQIGQDTGAAQNFDIAVVMRPLFFT